MTSFMHSFIQRRFKMSSNTGAKMKSIEEEMSRFEEEIMSLTQDPTPIGGAAPDQESNRKGSSLQFQPRQAQGQGGREGGDRGGGGGVPRAPGFQPRQMGRPGGNMPPRPNRPGGGHQGFVPHQLRVNQRPQGPPRFPHLPPPPPPPPMNSGGPMGPMGPGMGPPGPPPPNMMGPLPPPPMPPFAMMPPGPPPMNAQKPVTLSAKPTTYASKPVLNKKTKKKVKKEKSTESKDQLTSEEKEVKSADEPPAPSAAPAGPAALPHPAPQQVNMPPMNLPPPPAIPQAFVPTPAAAADLSQLTQGGEYELGTASEPLKKKDKKKKHIRVAAGTTWEDDSLAEWDPNDFRLFAGDLGNEVTEDTLTKVFGTYPSYLKCKIIRDKRTNKTKGYGFISFKDPRDFVQAMKDWNGKYVGNRPIKLLKSTWKDRDISSVKKKQKEKDRLGLR